MNQEVLGLRDSSEMVLHARGLISIGKNCLSLVAANGYEEPAGTNILISR
ncbi:MAG TPA: hypothetical protein VGR81_00420 [Candidatus Acidoferrales bacterium]|nr:hypothetical protein [Candidatus Acidoferrales bacterium]